MASREHELMTLKDNGSLKVKLERGERIAQAGFHTELFAGGEHLFSEICIDHTHFYTNHT